METYLIVCGLLLAASVPVRVLPVTPIVADDDDAWSSDRPWNPRAVAYLRRGTYGLVLTVLAELHARGAVNARVSGRLRQLDPPVDGDYDDPLSTAVYRATRWCPEPLLIAQLPSVRWAARSVRSELVVKGLVPATRARLLSWTLLAFAAGLAFAGAAEERHGSTVVGALIVAGIAVALSTGPRRTIAGQRVLRAERHLLEEWTSEQTYALGIRRLAPLLASMVAVQGRAALDVLCDGYVAVGALAPMRLPTRPRPVAPTVVPEPARVEPAWGELSPSWEWSPQPVSPGPVRPRVPASYEVPSIGPALLVRPAFTPERQRLAA